MNHKVVFSSDLHGNAEQYALLRGWVHHVDAKTLILGGDLLPKKFKPDVLVQKQREYIRRELIPFLGRLKKERPGMGIFLILGNDDVSVNMDALMKGHPKIFQVIHSARARINADFEIVGYPFVPLTHAGLKDWDKFDMPEAEIPERFMAGHVLRMDEQVERFGGTAKSAVTKKYLRPWKPNEYGLVPCTEEEIQAAGYISEDLEKPVFTQNPGGTVYVMHAPPYATHLDINVAGHVGSIATRLFIEKYGPYLTLHGHIHSTVDRSGSFREKIGGTHSFSSGNSPKFKDSLRLLQFDLYDLERAERKIIQWPKQP